MILVSDIGTTVLKAGLVTSEGVVCAVSKQKMSLLDGCEANPLSWLEAFSLAMSELKAMDQELACIIISGNGPTLVPSDFGNALTWMHREADKESEIVSKAAGFAVDASFLVPKALFLKNRRPEVYEKNRYLLSTQEYVSFYLTDCARTVMPLEGLENCYWDDALLAKLDLDKTKFPPFIKPGEFLGRVTKEASKRFNVKEGTPVLAGCPDFYSAILGSGAVNAGQTCDRSGTSEGLNFCSSTKASDPRLMCYKHPNGRDWNVSGIISTSGKSISFVKKIFGLGDLPYKDFYECLSASPPGANGLIFHPYLAGERAPIWNHKAKGSFFGLGVNTTKEDMLRSVCEGVCLSIRDVLELLQENLPKGSITELRATGGPSENDFLNQLKADVTGLKLSVLQCPEPELLGLGILAYSSINGKDVAETADKLISIRKTYIPNEANHLIYNGVFAKYKEIYQSIKEVY